MRPLFLQRLILRRYSVGGDETARCNRLRAPSDCRAHRTLLLEINTEKHRVDEKAGDGVASPAGVEFGMVAQVVLIG